MSLFASYYQRLSTGVREDSLSQLSACTCSPKNNCFMGQASVSVQPVFIRVGLLLLLLRRLLFTINLSLPGIRKLMKY